MQAGVNMDYSEELVSSTLSNLQLLTIAKLWILTYGKNSACVEL